MAGGLYGRDTLTVRKNGSGALPNCSIREYAEKRLEGMKSERLEREPEVVDIAGFAQPMRTRFINAIATRGRSSSARMNKLYNGHAIRSFRFLTAGMYSGLSSPNRPWFRFTLEDRDLMKFHPVKIWLKQCEDVVALLLATSNFYGAVKLGYGEIGLFGTDACIMDETLDFETGTVRATCNPQTFGEYWIATNEDREPDTLMRQCTMTVRQMVGAFVVSKANPRDMDWSKVTPALKSAWDNGNYETRIGVYHAIEPNPDYTPGRYDAAGHPWRSIKWEAGQGDKETLLEHMGYHSQPFWAPRWEVVGGDVYGYGPGHDALADMRSLQLQAKRKGEATDFAVKPAIIAPASVKVKLYPGAVTYAAAPDQAVIKELWKADYRAIEIIGRDEKNCQDAIDEATYARLFMAITSMEGSVERNVPEIAAREEEKITQLGPVIERVNNEKLQVAIDRAFDIAARNDMFPPAPEELQGMLIKVDFISILAQAQRMIGMTQTERAVGFVATLDKAFPGCGAGDNVDADKLSRDYWDRSGASPDGLRDERERDELRQARQQQQAADRAAQMAPAAGEIAGAAKTMSETQVSGGDRTLFDALIGAAPIG